MIEHPRAYYLKNVYPHVPTDVKQTALHHYPGVSLTANNNTVTLAQRSVVMLVGLTGTGKSTTLAALKDSDALTFSAAMPSRRDIANLILIPTAQTVLQEQITPVKDRERRFGYTRVFREQVAGGGTATAFTWLFIPKSGPLIVSEGVRGANEIEYALTHTRWTVVELWVDPVTRLRRLSNRSSAFDTVAEANAADLSFLPSERHTEVRAALSAGEITPTAIATVRAEAANYGAHPYDPANTTPNYHCLQIDDTPPEEVAASVASIAQKIST